MEADGVVLCQEEDLAGGRMVQAMAGDERVLVCQIDGEVHAVEGVCPHRGALLSQGQMLQTAVVCPWHQWAFDLTTGKGITNPHSCLKKYQVTIQDGQVKLRQENS
jgi:nitrite reductase/ring-hydroxylating ferredoxin subunit